MPPAEVWTGTSRYGAPLAGRGERDDERFAVSLTHTNDAVVAAASPDAARLGVDVERLDRTVRAGALARRYFAPGEADELGRLAPNRRREAFLRAWTLKEAWGKATGMGVPRALPLVAFPMHDLAAGGGPPEARPARIRPPAETRFPGPWRLWTAAVGIHSLGVAAAGHGRVPGPTLPHFPPSAMIRRLHPVGGAPVVIYRMLSPPR